jgi:hypothetical protein
MQSRREHADPRNLPSDRLAGSKGCNGRIRVTICSKLPEGRLERIDLERPGGKEANACSGHQARHHFGMFWCKKSELVNHYRSRSVSPTRDARCGQQKRLPDFTCRAAHLTGVGSALRRARALMHSRRMTGAFASSTSPEKQPTQQPTPARFRSSSVEQLSEIILQFSAIKTRGCYAPRAAGLG